MWGGGRESTFADRWLLKIHMPAYKAKGDQNLRKFVRMTKTIAPDQNWHWNKQIFLSKVIVLESNWAWKRLH